MADPKKPLFDADEPTVREAAALTAPRDDELEPVLTAPPEADVVAGRALMVAALIDRAQLESSRDQARFAKLQAWVEQHGLFGNLGADGAELFDAPLGSWTDDDVDAVGWTGEELQLLLWALRLADFPSLESPADTQALLQKVPLLGDADAFLEVAALRPVDELEEKRALYDALNEAVRSEVYARSLQEDPASLEADDELEELLASVEQDGFDRQAAAAGGKAAEAIAGLRYWARTLLNELFGAGSPHLADRLDSPKLVSLEDAALATMLGLAHARSESLAWLMEGDEYEAEASDDEG